MCAGLPHSPNGDLVGKVRNRCEEIVGTLSQIKGVRRNPDTDVADFMRTGHLAALGIDKVSLAESQSRAVRQELVLVGIREPGKFLGLVLGIDQGEGSPVG